jgi:hypothetical protein
LHFNYELAALPRVLFAELCSLTSLEVRGVASAAFDDDSFAGFSRCENVMHNDEAKEMCESQQDIFVEGSCSAQLCETGDAEGSCGSYGWCAWQADGDGGGSCTIRACGVGEEPKMGEGWCGACEAGKYSNSVGSGLCASCAIGKYIETVGSATEDDCEECEAGKTSLMGAVECVAGTTIADTADHAWDFRGCTDGVPVVDSPAASELQATLMNGASCTAEGVAFDGVDGYVDLDDWEWGGAFTIEAYLKFDNFRDWMKVLDFGDGSSSDNVVLGTKGGGNEIDFAVFQGGEIKSTDSSIWILGEWTHIVVGVAGTTAKVFENGVLVGSKEDGHEPPTVTRGQHWLGRSSWEWDPYFEGTVAYVRMWHGAELAAEDVQVLYSERDAR